MRFFRGRLGTVCLLAALMFWPLQGAHAQTPAPGGNQMPVNPLEKSLRGAALQIAAASLFDGSGGMNVPEKMPQKVAVLPLRVEKGGLLPRSETEIRVRFADWLGAVRHGNSALFALLPPKESAPVTRMVSKGVPKQMPDDKVLQAARKAGADYVLWGILTPPLPGSRDGLWLGNWFLTEVGSGNKNDPAPLIKSRVATTLDFSNNGGQP